MPNYGKNVEDVCIFAATRQLYRAIRTEFDIDCIAANCKDAGARAKKVFAQRVGLFFGNAAHNILIRDKSNSVVNLPCICNVAQVEANRQEY